MEQARTTNRLVGSPIERIEDLRFLRGRGEYVGDLAVDGMLHAVVLRSSFAHGRIRGIDVSAARAVARSATARNGSMSTSIASRASSASAALSATTTASGSPT